MTSQEVKKKRNYGIKSGVVPLRELISCWIDLPGSILTAAESPNSSLSPAMSAQPWSTTLEDVNVPQLTAVCFYHSLPPSLSLSAPTGLGSSVFLFSLSLSLCPLAHKPCQQRNCERGKHTSLFSSSYPSLLLFLLILVVFHREVPQPVILHHHITSTQAAGVEQAVQSVFDSSREW